MKETQRQKNSFYAFFALALFLIFCSGNAQAANSKPTIKGTPSLKVKVGAAFNFTPAASDPDGDPLTFSILNKPAWLTFDTATGALTGTPTAADIGTSANPYTISVSDGKGGTAKLAAYNIKVLEDAVVSNTPPVINGVPSLKLNVGENFSFTPTASDANNDALTFSITNKPGWASFNTSTGELSGKPSEADAGLTHSGYVISVSDGKGGMASLAAFNINVIGKPVIVGNHAPVITGSTVSAAKQGVPFTFSALATDVDNDTLTYSIANKPAWANFDTGTGKLSGIPAITDLGTFSNISISVSDGKVSSALPAFDITVSEAGQPVKLSAFGVASQSTTYTSSYPASNAIDGNTDTFNHTNCRAGDWWQLELKGKPPISSIVITNRDSSALAIDRLSGATVYVSDTPAVSNSWNPAEMVATLTGALTQTIPLAPMRTGKYVIVKTFGSDCLHMAEVAVNGYPSDAPVFEQDPYTINSSYKITAGELAGFVKAFDYQNQPITYNLEGATNFTINSTTGRIEPTGPLRQERYTFVATASDGVNITKVPVTLNAPVNLAREFGIASQGSDFDTNSIASYAIDGSLDTKNLTSCYAPGNWWQVKLPEGTLIKKLYIANATTAQWLINNLQIYITNSPYNGVLNPSDKVDTLQSSLMPRTIEFSTPKAGTYVIAKAQNNDCVRMAEMEVYGQLQAAPRFDKTAYTFPAGWNYPAGTVVGSITAVDFQLNPITYSVEGAVPFTINAQGKLLINGALQSGATHSFTVAASDGVNTSRVPVTVNVTLQDAFDQAVRTGNAGIVSELELLDGGIAKAQALADSCSTTLATIYPNGLETATFPYWSSYTTSFYSGNIPLHVAADGGDFKVFSWLGEKPSGVRYAMLGANTFGVDTVNVQLRNSTLNMLRWLLKRPVNADILNETLTVLVPRSDDRTSLAKWFTANGLTHRWTIATSTALLATGAFDLYLGDVESRPVTDFQQAFSAGKPVIAVNNWFANNATALAEFGLSFIDYWATKPVGDYPSIDAQCAASSPSRTLLKLFNTFKTGVPEFIYEAGDCKTSAGQNVSCFPDKITDSSGNSAADLYYNAATSLRNLLKGLDSRDTSVFSLDAGADLTKIAVLLGDKYRAEVRFPMDKLVTDSEAFHRSLFADATVHFARPDNVYQPDMGKFTDAQALLNTQASATRTVTFTPTAFSEWTSTGFYAPPGKTITVRRTDSGTAKARLRLNMIGSDSTHVWESWAYNRPRYLTTPAMDIVPGKTYTFSSPYGGPVYVGWDAVASNPAPITFEISNLLPNPILTAFDDASVLTFLDEVKNTDSDWIDIKTPYAELHSLKEHLLTAFAKQDGNVLNGYTTPDVQAYIDDLNNYLIAGNYALVGFTGTGLPPLSSGVQGYCSTFGLASVLYDGATKNLCTDPVIHSKPKVQHINADIQASCGALCSGNPFDSGSPIMPLGYGENHEMGHNLQRSRFNLNQRSGENNVEIFSIHTQWAWTVAKGLTKHPTSKEPKHKAAFDYLQAAIAQGIPAGLTHPLWAKTGAYDDNTTRLAFHQQLIYTEQSWDLYTKLFIMERIFSDAIKTDAKWNAAKDLIGFGNYTRDQASNMYPNDYMYVSASFITQRNYSDFFEVWGLNLTDTAKNQVASNNILMQVPKRFYYVNDEMPAVFPTIVDTIPLDGVSPWQDPTP